MKDLQGVYVLWLRDMKRYVRARSRLFGSLGMPLFFLISFNLGFRRAQIPSLNISYTDFLAPGVVAMVVLFTSVFSGVSVVWDRQFGFLREIMVAPISRTAIALGRILGGATTAVVQGWIMLVVSLAIGFVPHFAGLLPATLFMMLTAIAFTGVGVAISTLMKDIHGFQIIINFFVFPVFLLSGAIFPVKELGNAAFLAMINPLSYGVDGIRWSLTGYTEMGPLHDLFALTAFSIAIVLLASFLFERTEV
ncbi:ABC-2 type transporter [Archaeoglobus veneficus SNP6]|uniref:ABC-2 type transporter n=2 Tax=Archaeoglobus veneficus TaxID=58290 RepID=F2KQJ8_ARCVS|nr:ABC-2 type transporter [Archaeoglobus veneficus SNP6]